MALKHFNPVTASLRGTVLIDRSELWKGKPVKGLTEGKSSTGGRNNHGRITSRFRGGGHKQSYRIVDFKRRKFDVPATVERLEYDPNRTAFIALIKYAGRRAGLHPGAAAAEGRRHGDLRRARRHQAGQRDAAGGDSGRHDHPQHRDEGRRRRQDRALGRHLSRSWSARTPGYAQIKLMSGELRMVRGRVHGDDRRGVQPRQHEPEDRQGRPHRAGSGRRPHNRGVVMNPVDHPHGRWRRPHLRRPSSGVRRGASRPRATRRAPTSARIS